MSLPRRLFDASTELVTHLNDTGAWTHCPGADRHTT